MINIQTLEKSISVEKLKTILNGLDDRFFICTNTVGNLIISDGSKQKGYIDFNQETFKLLDLVENETDKNNSTFPASDMEQNPCHEPMGKDEIEKVDTRCRLHLRSYRHRLADPDGVSCKYAIDGLIHAGLLSDDSPSEIIEVTYSQEKIARSEMEKTEIIVTFE